MTPETASKIAIIRQKVVDGTVTTEELKEGVMLMRQDRRTAATPAASAKRAKAIAAIPSADDLLGELMS